MPMVLVYSPQSLNVRNPISKILHIQPHFAPAPGFSRSLGESAWFRAPLVPTTPSLSSSSLQPVQERPHHFRSTCISKLLCIMETSWSPGTTFLTTLDHFCFSVRGQDLDRRQGCQKHKQRGVPVAGLPIGRCEFISNISG